VAVTVSLDRSVYRQPLQTYRVTYRLLMVEYARDSDNLCVDLAWKKYKVMYLGWSGHSVWESFPVTIAHGVLQNLPDILIS